MYRRSLSKISLIEPPNFRSDPSVACGPAWVWLQLRNTASAEAPTAAPTRWRIRSAWALLIPIRSRATITARRWSASSSTRAVAVSGARTPVAGAALRTKPTQSLGMGGVMSIRATPASKPAWGPLCSASDELVISGTLLSFACSYVSLRQVIDEQVIDDQVIDDQVIVDQVIVE